MATVLQKTGPVLYRVQLDDYTILHFDFSVPVVGANPHITEQLGSSSASSLEPVSAPVPVPEPRSQEPSDSVATPPSTPMNTDLTEQEETSQPRHYPSRVR